MKNQKIVMLIDDDPDDRDLFTEIVEEIDGEYKCICASDGQEGLDKLKEMKSDLPAFIFLDLNMPRMNGKQCLSEIKKIDRLKHIPVIIYSTSKLASDVEETKLLGATTFLTKPGLYRELKEVIVNILVKKTSAGLNPRNIIQSV